LNLTFVLNYLAIEKDYNTEVEKARKQAEQKHTRLI